MSDHKDEPPPDDAAVEASRWLTRLQKGELPDQTEFAEWLRAQPSHVLEFLVSTCIDLELQALEFTGDLPASELVRQVRVATVTHSEPNVIRFPVKHGPPASPLPSHLLPLPQASRRRFWAIAASLVAFAPLLLFLEDALSSPTYQTLPGSSRLVSLSDGSQMRLNSSTRVKVHFRDRLCHIELVEGEAMFEVAPDASRSFRVTSHGAVVQALGTEFDVQIRDTRLTVTVKSGRVAVLPQGNATPLNQRAELTHSQRVLVNVGSTAGIALVQSLNEAQMKLALEWMQSVDLGGMSLKSAVERFNRTSDLKLVIDDPSIEDQRLGGRFVMANPRTFVKALERMHIAAVAPDTEASNVIHLTRAPQGEVRARPSSPSLDSSSIRHSAQ